MYVYVCQCERLCVRMCVCVCVCVITNGRATLPYRLSDVCDYVLLRTLIRLSRAIIVMYCKTNRLHHICAIAASTQGCICIVHTI